MLVSLPMHLSRECTTSRPLITCGISFDSSSLLLYNVSSLYHTPAYTLYTDWLQCNAMQVEECEEQMRPLLGGLAANLDASSCELKVEEQDGGVIRIFRQSGSTTPKSVLQTPGHLHCHERLCFDSALQSPATWH